MASEDGFIEVVMLNPETEHTTSKGTNIEGTVWPVKALFKEIYSNCSLIP